MKKVWKHIVTYNREGEVKSTGCGLIGVPSKEMTGQHAAVTCPRCKAYIRQTGDGPEILKGLLSFRF